jgi:hypothetical protein
MASLDRNLRRTLENAIAQARRVAEAGARQALEQLAVHEPSAAGTAEQRPLRNRLRAHARQLGDERERNGAQVIERLVGECAYEHWHRLLFARFLAENNLLIELDSGMSLSLDECHELARERHVDWLPLASGFAQRMLPQIFRSDDPVLEVALPPETRQALERILEGLQREVFTSDDSLGWVYQFWQAEEKDVVNERGEKIGARDLPAVTQLFTEDYMVLFLLHNTLGAWWAGKHLAAHPELARDAADENELRRGCSPPGYEWTYLRFVREEDGTWRPAAGAYAGWPTEAKKIRVLDPCMGSGHFLVFALPILVAIRMAEEGLALAEAIDAVLRYNLFGLELDLRCTQIAAFNLALAAWKLTGYRPLPPMHLACSGLGPGMTKREWLDLARRAAALLPVAPDRNLFGTADNLFSQAAISGLEALYDLFAQAPTLGSLIDPQKSGTSLLQAGFERLEPLLQAMLSLEGSDEMKEVAVSAQGMSKAAETLAKRFTLVATNVPYLSRSRQADTLREYCATHYGLGKNDLATCFLSRTVEIIEAGGTTALVTPTNWMALSRYEGFRREILASLTLNAMARLDAGAFETISGEVVSVGLVCITNSPPSLSGFTGVDASADVGAPQKAAALMMADVAIYEQARQLANPDARLLLESRGQGALLARHADSRYGLRTGDLERLAICFWELCDVPASWRFFQGTVRSTRLYGGRERVLRWDDDAGALRELADQGVASIQGAEAWNRQGVAVSLMGELPVTVYTGEIFDNGTAVVWPRVETGLPGLYAYLSSDLFRLEVRKLDSSIKVTNQTLIKVPFDHPHWDQVARVSYPNGLPEPSSTDPTQWLFNGFPQGSDAPLQVAVARLVGYRWPRQTGSQFMDCPALGPDGIQSHADEDGIVCLAAIRNKEAAAGRVRRLLADVYGSEWPATRQSDLLAAVGYGDQTLEEWLRDGFFAQHLELFHNRPFVWHVWDGRTDGFHALVNYHRLVGPGGEGRRTLEKLTHTYLGDWITRQRAEQAAGVEAADARVAAAEHLRTQLERILEGEEPFDIFVRWKPLRRQAIGWEPDLEDGVRMNIRPFLTARPLGARARDACILRVPPKIKWEKDRGKEPSCSKDEFPWFWSWDEAAEDFTGGDDFDGNRWNDLHYSLASKRAARGQP